MVHTFTKRTALACSARELYDWHLRPEAFTELQPPWERVRQTSEPEVLHEGQVVRIQVIIGPLRLPWESLISEMREGELFVDEQLRGPFASWRHEHRFITVEGHGSILEDHITYRLPLEPLSLWFAGGMVRNRLQRMFDYRHSVMLEHFGMPA